MLAPDLSIAEFIPLSAHVSPHVVKTTGGDFLLTWRLDGLPFGGREHGISPESNRRNACGRRWA